MEWNERSEKVEWNYTIQIGIVTIGIVALFVIISLFVFKGCEIRTERRVKITETIEQICKNNPEEWDAAIVLFDRELRY